MILFATLLAPLAAAAFAVAMISRRDIEALKKRIEALEHSQRRND